MTDTTAPRLFGTDGIRGIAGEYPLDSDTIALIGGAVTAIMREEVGRAPRFIIGRDTRESGTSIEREFAKGARAEGAHVESAGVITTPGVAYLARVVPFDAGVVVSASHNPYRDNGVKIFTPSGLKISDEIERAIEKSLRIGVKGDTPEQIDLDSSEGYVSSYIDFLCSAFDIRLDGLRLALDCANGAASAIAPEVFTRLGADLTVLSANPDGRNINDGCGSLYMGPLQECVLNNKLDVGIAFDGDADRALLVAENGCIVDGDHELLILADYLKSRGQLNGDVVVTTVMANLGLELALADRKIEMARVPVGDRYVLEEIRRRDASLGGEQSGHIIIPAVSLAGDGIITAIEMLRATASSGRTLGELASGLTKYPQVLVNVRVKSKPGIDSIPMIRREIARLEKELGKQGRLLVRYSGTENLARVMIEGERQAEIEAQANGLAELIRQELG